MSSKLLKSTITVSAMTTVSRVLGLIRDITIARLFGAGSGMDAFIVAFRIPNLWRRIFAEGGFSQAFVPVLSEYKQRRGEAAVTALIDQTAATLGLVLFIVTAIGVLLAPLFIIVFAPGFIGDQTKYPLAVDMLRVTFPYLLFISLTAFAAGILNAYQRFAAPAFTPVLLNLSLIGCAIWLSPLLATPIKALAWGVLFAGVIQLIFQVPFLYRIRKLPKPGLNRDRQGVKKILKLMLPAIFATSIVQINLLVDTLIASFLATGSITWLYFSDRLVEFPLGVFGIAMATVILPNLSRQYADGSERDAARTLDWGLRWTFLIGVPATLGLAILAQPLLTTLFHYNAFTAHDVLMSGKSLVAYSLGLTGFILVKILATGFFSNQDTKTPVKAGALAMIANIILNLLLVIPLAHAGLALATSLSAYIQAMIMYYILKHSGRLRPEPGWLKFSLQLLAAGALMAAVLLNWVAAPEVWRQWGLLDRGIGLLAAVFAGIAIYFSGLWLLGLRPAHMMIRS